MVASCGIFLFVGFLKFMAPLHANNEANPNKTAIYKDLLTVLNQHKQNAEIHRNAFLNPSFLSIENDQELEFYHEHPKSKPENTQDLSWDASVSRSNYSNHTSWKDALSSYEVQGIRDFLQNKPMKTNESNQSNSMSSKPVGLHEYVSFLDMLYQKIAQTRHSNSSDPFALHQTTTQSRDVHQQDVITKEDDLKMNKSHAHDQYLNLDLVKNKSKGIYLIVGDKSYEYDNVNNELIHPVTNNITNGTLEQTSPKEEESNTIIKLPNATTLTPMVCGPENSFLSQNSFNGNSMNVKVNLHVFPINKVNIRDKPNSEPSDKFDSHGTGDKRTTVATIKELYQNQTLHLFSNTISNKTKKEAEQQTTIDNENHLSTFPATDKPMNFTTKFTENDDVSKITLELKVPNHGYIKSVQDKHASNNDSVEADFEKYPEVDAKHETIFHNKQETSQWEDLPIIDIEVPKDHNHSAEHFVFPLWMVAALSYIQSDKPIPESLKSYIAMKETPLSINKKNCRNRIIYSEKQLTSEPEPLEISPKGDNFANKLPSTTTHKTTTKTGQTFADNHAKQNPNTDQNVERSHFNPYWLKRGEDVFSKVTMSSVEKTSVYIENRDTYVHRQNDHNSVITNINPYWKNRLKSRLNSGNNKMTSIDTPLTTDKIEQRVEDTFRKSTRDQTRLKKNETRIPCSGNRKPIVVTTIERSNYIPRSDIRFVHFVEKADSKKTIHEQEK